jgi:hypothetical protein
VFSCVVDSSRTTSWLPTKHFIPGLLDWQGRKGILSLSLTWARPIIKLSGHFLKVLWENWALQKHGSLWLWLVSVQLHIQSSSMGTQQVLSLLPEGWSKGIIYPPIYSCCVRRGVVHYCWGLKENEAFWESLFLLRGIKCENWNWLLKINSKCVHKCQQKLSTTENKRHRFLLTKCKLNQEKNHFGAAKPRNSTIQKTRLDTR